MEWGAPFVAAIADEWLELEIARAQDDSRTITFRPHGSRFEALMTELIA